MASNLYAVWLRVGDEPWSTIHVADKREADDAAARVGRFHRARDARTCELTVLPLGQRPVGPVVQRLRRAR